MTKEPFDVLSDYFDAWQERNWKKMLGCCQISWIDSQPDPINDLKF